MSKTVKHNKKFTKEENEKIKQYFETPEEERIPLKEFAKSLNHSSRAVKERYIYYIKHADKEFTEEEIQMLIVYVDQCPRAGEIRWKNISIKLYRHKFFCLRLRDIYNREMKQRRKSSLNPKKDHHNGEKQQDDNCYSIFNDFVMFDEEISSPE